MHLIVTASDAAVMLMVPPPSQEDFRSRLSAVLRSRPLGAAAFASVRHPSPVQCFAMLCCDADRCMCLPVFRKSAALCAPISSPSSYTCRRLLWSVSEAPLCPSPSDGEQALITGPRPAKVARLEPACGR